MSAPLGILAPAKMTELQRVLRDIEQHPKTTLDEISGRTGLGYLVVEMLVKSLWANDIVVDDETDIGLSRYGDEIMGARTAEETPSGNDSVS